jgi:poly-gamma-glutamate capsule biosynthesis protein CapA/YwtB (metallophosphatase superfamily)
VHFADHVARLLASPATAVGPLAGVLRDADLAMVNLETAVTGRGTPEPKQYHFRTTPAAYEALRAAGVDAVSVANNHAMDYGRVGLLDTLDSAARARFPIVGAGRDAAAAYRPWRTEVRGVHVAVLAFSQVERLASTWAARDDRPGIAMAFDVRRAVGAVRAARRQADLVVVFNHWGLEGVTCPTAEQRTFVGVLSRAGADVVVGAHAHVLQGEDRVGSTYVAYGLGNFVWYGASRSTDTGVLRLSVRGRRVVGSEFVPAMVSASGQPLPLTGAAAAAARARFAGVRGRCAGRGS